MKLVPTISKDEAVLVQALGDLNRIVPRNEYNFPVGIYRPDLLPMDDYIQEESAGDKLYALMSNEQTNETHLDVEVTGFEDQLQDQQALVAQTLMPTTTEHRVAGFPRGALKAAFVPLHYDEGYPMLPDGRPIWERYDFEPMDLYTCFQCFLQMTAVQEGVRSLTDLCDVMVSNEILEVNGFDALQYPAKFKALYTTYGWGIRTRSYDLYRVAAHRKKQELRQIETQDAHYGSSKRLMAKLLDYMESEEDFWDLMTPKVAESLYKTLTGAQRVAAGLPATAPLSVAKDGSVVGPQSIEMILRTMTKSSTEQEVLSDQGDMRLTSRILENPETTELVQELIIKMSQQ